MELVLKGLSKKFKDKVAVNNVSMKLNSGVYGLLGPNGSGKTTLMRMIADVMPQSEGGIEVDGVDKKVLDGEYRELLGYLPQDIGFYKNWSADKFLLYVAALKGIDKKKAKKRIHELLEFVNLTKDRKKKIGKYSGGMKQRLGIAQALLGDPKILILDEPTAGLDPNERIRFKNLLSSISKDKIIIFSTHIASDIEFIANNILIMKDGNLIDNGSVQDILNNARGKVWHCKIDESQLFDFENKYKVANILRENDKVLLRIISEEKPMEGAERQEPSLEDVFLHYFNEKSNF